MITEKQYKEAVANKEAADLVIDAYFKQKHESFEARWNRFLAGQEFFSDEGLVYSAVARCSKCGEGLAYPKDCSVNHQWSCSAVLKGVGSAGGHEAFPFAFYEIKSEHQPSANGATTRPK